MSEFVEYVSGLARAAPKLLYVAGLILLGLYFAERGHKVAQAEQAEDAGERTAA